MLLRLAARRLRRRPLRAALSIGGIALAVALTFAVQLVNANLTGSYETLRSEISGLAQLELVGRGGGDLDYDLLGRVAEAPGVAAAAPIVESEVVLRSRGNATAAHVVGLDNRARPLLAPGSRHLVARAGSFNSVGLYLPADLARRLDVDSRDLVEVDSAGDRSEVKVIRIVGEERAGTLAHSRVVAAPLDLAQQLTGNEGRLTRIVVRADPDARFSVAASLSATVGPAVVVRSTDTEGRLLRQASALDRRSAALFSAISILLGVLLAYTAMHLSVVERRREIAALRLAGTPNRALALSLLCEAAIVGVVGSAIGIALGLSAFAEAVASRPVYLEQAFPLASNADVPAGVVVLSVLVGLGAALTAAVLPARTMLSVAPIAALDERAAPRPRTWIGRRTALLAGIVGAGCLLGGGLLVLVRPEQGMPGQVIFFAGFALVVAVLAPLALAAVARTTTRWPPSVDLALAELRASPSRTSPLVAITAVTVAALIAVGGAVSNLEDGGVDLARGAFASSDLLLLPDQPRGEAIATRLPDETVEAVGLLPEVSSAAAYRSKFLDWRGRRVRVFAYAHPRLLGEQALVEGDLGAARRELASGRGALLSPDLASVLGAEIGDELALPTPDGDRRLRLSGLVSNFGWGPGVVTLGGTEFVRSFGSDTTIAAQVDLAPGISEEAGRRALGELSETIGFRIETVEEAERRALDVTRQALGQLRRIAIVFLVASMVAVAGIMITSVVQRRQQLAALRAVGLAPAQLQRSILAETCVVLGLALTMALCGGLTAQFLIARYLAGYAGYPVAFTPEPGPLIAALATGSLAALLAGAFAARTASRQAVPRALAYE